MQSGCISVYSSEVTKHFTEDCDSSEVNKTWILSLKVVQRKYVLWRREPDVVCSFAENDLQLSESGSESDDWPRRPPARGQRIILSKGKGNRAQARLNFALSHFRSFPHFHSSAGKIRLCYFHRQRKRPKHFIPPARLQGACCVHVCKERCLCVGVPQGATIHLTSRAHMQLNI